MGGHGLNIMTIVFDDLRFRSMLCHAPDCGDAGDQSVEISGESKEVCD